MPPSRDEDRVVLVTGASSGIGLATARLLARRGLRVFGTSRTPHADAAGEVEMLALDTGEEASVRACVDTVLERAGRLDILVNNAGGGIAGAVEEVSIAEAKAVFEVNLWGAVRMTQAVLPTMRARGGGQIIAMSSMAGLIGVPFRGAYTASKFALESMFEALRYELDPIGIRVVLIKPSGVATPAADRVPRAELGLEDYREAGRNLSARFDLEMRDGMPPEQVARTIVRVIDQRRPRLRYPVGAKVRVLGAAQTLLPERVFVAGMSRLVNRAGRSRRGHR